jgi:hypothetical protein
MLDTATLDLAEAAGRSHAAAGHAGAAGSYSDPLRHQVAERLAAHRDRRRPRAEPKPPSLPSFGSAPGDSSSASSRYAHIVAVVAERYARSPSYRAFLAAEAEKALEQARAAAEIAELNAQAVAEAQRQLLEALHEDPRSQEVLREDALGESGASAGAVLDGAHGDQIHSVFDDAIQEQLRALTLWPELEAGSLSRPSAPDTGNPRAASRRSQPASAKSSAKPEPGGVEPLFPQVAEPAMAPSAGLTVRLYEDGAGAMLSAGRFIAPATPASKHVTRHEERNDAEALALDEEIAFRQSPVFEEPALPPMPLPANLIEFPRQLVASRKARPRYAEGPLRDEPDAVPGAGQLRIFEVDPAEISTTPVTAETVAPQWTSIWLDAPGRTSAEPTASPNVRGQHTEEHAEPSAVPSLQPATIGRRFVAGAINAFLVLAGFLGFAVTFVLVSTRAAGWHSAGSFRILLGRSGMHQMAGLAAQTGVQPGLAMAAGAMAIGFLYLVYQALFFVLSDATPGMRIARIALCTFSDESPTPSAMRGRILAVLLSACPLGLGFVWAALDEDRLTWHDRISRMYLRRY